MKNSFLRALVPLLSIGLNDDPPAESGGSEGAPGDAGAEGGSQGGDQPKAEPEKPPEGGDKKPAEGDKKPADDAAAKKTATDAATKASAELAKSYEGWKPKLPEGMPFDEKGFAQYSKTFAELGLKPEQSQKLVDLFAGAEMGRIKSVAEGLQKEVAGYEKALKSDPELAGKDGKQLEQTMRDGKRAMMKFASPKLREVLANSGLDKHPEMIRAFARAGKGIAEDNTKDSRAGGKGPELTKAQKLAARYPNSPELHNSSS